ncbi:excisionase family DNA-binding protein [Desulfobacter postgatei]|uniref:excisionase family DNA-binding protein n=1 Tax=Desulfobacter postgatei TaxID=2293 RepID=UPI00259AF381|nr:excisionase family DNA-binding protein [uncultured Desulfobacter sp.]
MPEVFQQQETEAKVTWGEIAGYLRVSVSTAQRWYRDNNLPVRKPGGGGVRAYPDELDAWVRGGEKKK